MSPIAGVILAYLAGSIPSAYIAGKLRGVDLRKHGSGNLGDGSEPAKPSLFLGGTADGIVSLDASPHWLGRALDDTLAMPGVNSPVPTFE